MNISQDHHIHTVYSGHSSRDMTVAAIVEKAAALDLRRIVILEHIPDIQRDRRAVLDGVLGEASREPLRAIGRDLAAVAERGTVRVFRGAEIDADPNARDGRLLLADLSGIDVVMAACHYVADTRAMWFDLAELPRERLDRLYEIWMVWAMHVAANPAVDVLAHPGAEMASFGAIQRFEGRVLEDFEKLLRLCRKHETAIDLNESMVRRLSPETLAGYETMIETARDLGVRISIGSDAHQLDRIGAYPWLSTLAERLGLKPEHYFHPAKR